MINSSSLWISWICGLFLAILGVREYTAPQPFSHAIGAFNFTQDPSIHKEAIWKQPPPLLPAPIESLPISVITTTTTVPPSPVVVTTAPIAAPVPIVEQNLSSNAIAQSLIGKTRTELGFSNFWCSEFVEFVLAKANRTIDNPLHSPSQLALHLTPTTTPQPGDVVFISYFPQNSGQIDHTAILLSLTPEGANVIEGNGSTITQDQVGTNFWPNANVISYGDAHEPAT